MRSWFVQTGHNKDEKLQSVRRDRVEDQVLEFREFSDQFVRDLYVVGLLNDFSTLQAFAESIS